MFRTSLVSSLLALTTILVGVNALTIQPSEAVERFNGQRAFESSPRLVRTATRFSSRSNAAATYQFTIEVPDNAGEALKAVRISQIDGLETVMFNNQKNRGECEERRY